MNTFEDYRRLIDILRNYGCPVRIGFEATHNYHRTLVYQLAMTGFELQLILSVAIARTREALHNSWDKNDPKDTQVTLHMLEIGTVKVFYDLLIAQTNDIQGALKT